MSNHAQSPGKFSIGLVQCRVGEDAEENVAAALAWVEKAARQGAQVICLPELYRSRYFCQKEDPALFQHAETLPGDTVPKFQKAAEKHGVAIILPVFEKRAAGVYHNSAVVIDAGGANLGLYRKMHIPDDPAYYEKYYFAPGDLGFKVFQTSFGPIGVLICWDQWFPEAARLTALRGASVLFYPTAIGWHPHEKAQYGAAQRDAWRTVQRGHAIANGVYVAAANRTGFEQAAGASSGIEFWGSSFVVDPQGVLVSEASVEKEEVLLAEIDPGHIETIRTNWPFLRDRRIDAYGGITKRYLDEDQE